MQRWTDIKALLRYARADFLDSVYQTFQVLRYAFHKLFVFFGDHGPLGGCDDDALSFEDSERISYLVFRKVQNFGKTDNAYRLIFQSGAEQIYVALYELYLFVSAAG